MSVPNVQHVLLIADRVHNKPRTRTNVPGSLVATVPVQTFDAIDRIQSDDRHRLRSNHSGQNEIRQGLKQFAVDACLADDFRQLCQHVDATIRIAETDVLQILTVEDHGLQGFRLIR